MKLNNQYEVCEINNEVVLVYMGESKEQPPHVMQANETAGVILQCLKQETTLEEIYSTLENGFSVEHQEVVSDVQVILNQLRAHGALIE